MERAGTSCSILLSCAFYRGKSGTYEEDICGIADVLGAFGVHEDGDNSREYYRDMGR